jgi:hypothetical protein
MNLSYTRKHAKEILPYSCCVRKMSLLKLVESEEISWMQRVLKCSVLEKLLHGFIRPYFLYH